MTDWPKQSLFHRFLRNMLYGYVKFDKVENPQIDKLIKSFQSSFYQLILKKLYVPSYHSIGTSSGE